MYRDPHLVRSVIIDQNLTRCVAYDIGRKDKLAFCEKDSSAELVEYLNQLLDLITGPFRFEAWKAGDKPDAGGRGGTTREAFVWLMQGGGQTAPAPIPAMHTIAIDTEKTDSVMTASEAIALHVECAQLRLTVDSLRDTINQLREQIDTLEEDLEEAEAASKPNPMDDLISMLRSRLMPTVPAAPDTPVTGTGTVSTDTEFLAAMDKMAAAHPDDVAGYRKQIIDAYGPAKG